MNEQQPNEVNQQGINLPRAELMAVVSVVVFVGLIAVATFFTGIEQVWQEFKRLDLTILPALLLLSFINLFLRGFKWHVFAQHLEMGVPLRRMMLYYLAGTSMIVTPGKLGTSLRLWFLNKCHNINYSSSLPLMVMDPITDLSALFLLCVIGALSVSGHWLAITIFGLILAGCTLIFARPRLLQAVIKGLYALFGKRHPRLFASLQKVSRYITMLVSSQAFGKTIILSIIGWLSSITAFWWMLDSMGTGITFNQALFIFSFATILGGAIMLPGGLGGTDGAIFGLLLVLDVPADTALAATTIIRLITLWFSVLIGFIILPCGMKLAQMGK